MNSDGKQIENLSDTKNPPEYSQGEKKCIHANNIV